MNGRKVVVVCWWLNDIFHFSEYYKIAEKHTNKVLAVVFGPTINCRRQSQYTQSLKCSSRIRCPSCFHALGFSASFTRILFHFPFLSTFINIRQYSFLFSVLRSMASPHNHAHAQRPLSCKTISTFPLGLGRFHRSIGLQYKKKSNCMKQRHKQVYLLSINIK